MSIVNMRKDLIIKLQDFFNEFFDSAGPDVEKLEKDFSILIADIIYQGLYPLTDRESRDILLESIANELKKL